MRISLISLNVLFGAASESVSAKAALPRTRRHVVRRHWSERGERHGARAKRSGKQHERRGGQRLRAGGVGARSNEAGRADTSTKGVYVRTCNGCTWGHWQVHHWRVRAHREAVITHSLKPVSSGTEEGKSIQNQPLM